MKKQIKIGSWLTIGNTSIIEVMADAGFDWLCIDIEHSSIDFEKMKNMIMVIQGKGLKAFVRVGENNKRIIKRVLDSGPDGLIIPNIDSLSDAKKAVEFFNYPPKGTRGVGLSRAQNYGFDFENYRDYKTKNLLLIAQIEHINAIKDLEKIIELDGIDGTFIGPYDLSGSMNKPGQLNDPKVLDAIKSYEIIAKKHSKLIGFHVVPIDYNLVNEKIDEGYNFIGFGFDAYFLGNSIRNQLKNIK